jgi:hypothetical protein
VSDVEYDLDLDGEDGTEETEAPTPAPSGPDVDWQKETEKARKEAHGLRERLRRSEIAAEYGKDVAELLPAGLPIKEWKGYAEKLTEFRGQQAPPAQASEDAPEAPPEEPTEAEKQLATASGGPATGTSQAAQERLTIAEMIELGKRDPAEAQARIAADLQK